MIQPGEVVREAEFRKRELEASLVRQQRHSLPQQGWRTGNRREQLRDIYYRQLASVAGRGCALGLTVGCTLEARAIASRRAASQ
jgi:hypothetical protein